MIPERNLFADIGVTSVLVTPERCLLWAAFGDGVRSPSGSGGASLGVLATLADVAASDPAIASAPGSWTATQDLSVHGAVPVADGPIVVDARLVRAGKKVVVVRGAIHDAHGLDDVEAIAAAIDRGATTPAASALVTFARIPRSAASGVDDHDPGGWVGEVRRHGSPSTPVGSLHERVGIEVVDAAAGELRLAKHPYVLNSIGTINGGALAILVEAAAEASRPSLVATDVQQHYLAQVTDGPARTSVSVLREAPDHAVVAVEVVDAGAGDRLLTLATVLLRRP